jgi:hypothetical protein
MSSWLRSASWDCMLGNRSSDLPILVVARSPDDCAFGRKSAVPANADCAFFDGSNEPSELDPPSMPVTIVSSRGRANSAFVAAAGTTKRSVVYCRESAFKAATQLRSKSA